MNNKKWLVGLALLCNVGVAFAQDSELTISAGARAWWTHWTTFSYTTDENGDSVITESQASDELVLMPNVSVRKGKFSGSISAYPSKSFSFSDGASGKREELDLNAGYAVIPGLTVTLGYKDVKQSGSAGVYRPRGPVIGVSGFAPLSGLFSLYGSLGLGHLQTQTGDDIDFKMDYTLTELGLGYTPNTVGQGRLTITGGFRIQVLDSQDALGSQDGRDTTKGFTLGANYTF